MDVLLKSLRREFGWKTKIFAALSEKVLYRTLKKEETRLVKGWLTSHTHFMKKMDRFGLLNAQIGSGALSPLVRGLPVNFPGNLAGAVPMHWTRSIIKTAL